MKINYRHFALFYIAKMLEVFIQYWIYSDISFEEEPAFESPLWQFLVNLEIVSTVIICWGLIFFYKGIRRLKFHEKLLALIGLLISNFTWVTIINYFNFFDRLITTEDLIEGSEKFLFTQMIILIICLPIIALTKSRLKKDRL